MAKCFNFFTHLPGFHPIHNNMPVDATYSSAVTEPYIKHDRQERICPFSVPGKPHPAGLASDDCAARWVDAPKKAAPPAVLQASAHSTTTTHGHESQRTPTAPLRTSHRSSCSFVASATVPAAPTKAPTTPLTHTSQKARKTRKTPDVKESFEKEKLLKPCRSKASSGGKLRRFVRDVVGTAAVEHVMRRLDGLGLVDVDDLQYLEESDLNVYYVPPAARAQLMTAASRVGGANAVGVDSKSGRFVVVSSSGGLSHSASDQGNAQGTPSSPNPSVSASGSIHSWSGEYPVTLKGASPLFVVSGKRARTIGIEK